MTYPHKVVRLCRNDYYYELQIVDAKTVVLHYGKGEIVKDLDPFELLPRGRKIIKTFKNETKLNLFFTKQIQEKEKAGYKEQKQEVLVPRQDDPCLFFVFLVHLQGYNYGCTNKGAIFRWSVTQNGNTNAVLFRQMNTPPLNMWLFNDCIAYCGFRDVFFISANGNDVPPPVRFCRLVQPYDDTCLVVREENHGLTLSVRNLGINFVICDFNFRGLRFSLINKPYFVFSCGKEIRCYNIEKMELCWKKSTEVRHLLPFDEEQFFVLDQKCAVSVHSFAANQCRELKVGKKEGLFLFPSGAIPCVWWAYSHALASSCNGSYAFLIINYKAVEMVVVDIKTSTVSARYSLNLNSIPTSCCKVGDNLHLCLADLTSLNINIETFRDVYGGAKRKRN